MRKEVRIACGLAVLVAALLGMAPARLNADREWLATPTTMVRFYLHALGSGQCDLAFKFGGQSSRSLSAFRQRCRAIRRIVVEQLSDPGYRLHRQNAAYTCIALRYTVYGRASAATFGGWYLVEQTVGPSWHILPALSHVPIGGRAISLTKTEGAGQLPSYVRPGSGTIVSGSAFLSATTGWVALSTSGSYLPNGSCTHGIGSNCNSAATTIYRTRDAGTHWASLLHITGAVGPPVWVRLFNARQGLVADTVGPLGPNLNAHPTAALFSTDDGGRHWRRFPLPVNYTTQNGSISFPDSQHGWLWYGGGAAGSMAVDVYRTGDGGHHWSRVACTSFSNPGPGYKCPHQSGIGLGGDKEYLTFRGAKDGWLTAVENTGVPDLYQTADGGTSWRRQAVGLPPGVALPTSKSIVFPLGILLQPRFFGRNGLLPESVGFYQPKTRASWYRTYVLRSMDGGRTWSSSVQTPVTTSGALWQAIDARHWKFISNGAVWSTDNGGMSWMRARPQFPAGLKQVGLQFINWRVGWATARTHAGLEVSASGTALLHTMDGGVHWARAQLP